MTYLAPIPVPDVAEQAQPTVVGSIALDRPKHGAMSGRMRLALILIASGWLWGGIGWVGVSLAG